MNAPSTIAMSAYNLLALRGPEHVDAVLDLLRLEGVVVHKIDYLSAIDELLRRKFARQTAEGILSAAGPRGWIVTTRDRSADGWSGWVARNPRGDRRSLAELLEAA